jgi:hypothetical protein
LTDDAGQRHNQTDAADRLAFRMAEGACGLVSSGKGAHPVDGELSTTYPPLLASDVRY